MSKIYIGTSGWVYSDWQGIFYPENLSQNRWLEFYSQNFSTVEVNSTFYHQMSPSVFGEWAKKVPKDFVFSIKAPRFITHIKRLLDCKEPLKRLLEQSKVLREKLGPILFQLPPTMKADAFRLEEFCKLLPQENRFAFEFRDKSWMNDSVFKILAKYNLALVINDSPNFPKVEEITSDFIYIRFHGPSVLYSSEYSNSELESWAGKIENWLKNKIDVYCYFNNDVGGYAVANAKTLISMTTV